MKSTFGITASGLSKWFGQIIAINDLNFESSAPIVGLLGPNGAGKSTLIKLMVGQIKPSKGRIEVLGYQPWANCELNSKLGYCPEHDRFYEDMSALEFLKVLTRLHGYYAGEAASLSQEALALVGLSDESNKRIRNLSHGMRQRLKLAQALAHRPKLLVLDEPLSGMDPLNRSHTIEVLRKQADQGVKVLVSSHVLHELEAITSEILLLNRGRMLAQGQVQKIRDLIDSHPHRISLSSERPRELGRELLRHDDVVRVEIRKDTVVLETHSPDDCYDRIGELAADSDFEISAMVSLDDNLEAVFRYLVK